MSFLSFSIVLRQTRTQQFDEESHFLHAHVELSAAAAPAVSGCESSCVSNWCINGGGVVVVVAGTVDSIVVLLLLAW